MASFSETLKALRKERGLTQKELAEKLSTSIDKIATSTIGMYEQGRREPDFDTLDLLADFFNVDTDFLLGKTRKTTYCPNPNSKDGILLGFFHELNNEGQTEAIKQVENLTYNPNYQKVAKVDFKILTKDLHVIAAHNDDQSPEQVDLMRKDIVDLLNDD